MVTADRIEETLYFDAKVLIPDAWDVEECLPDDRAGLRPSEVVQQKFLSHMPDLPVPISSLHHRRLVRR